MQEAFLFVTLTYMEESEKTKEDDSPKIGEPYGAEVEDLELKAMLEACLHFGHRKTRQHPKMQPYIFGIRANVSIIDLEQTKKKLDQALEYLTGQSKEGKIILFVDTRPSTRGITRAAAEELGAPYVVERWSGGTITNWKTIALRIERLKELEGKRSSEEWEKYTKKERHDFEQEFKKLHLLWGGVKNLNGLADILFVVDMKADSLAVKEAKRKGIPIVAIADTNVDPTLADYPIPANDDALSAVRYILERVKGAIAEGRKK